MHWSCAHGQIWKYCSRFYFRHHRAHCLDETAIDCLPLPATLWKSLLILTGYFRCDVSLLSVTPVSCRKRFCPTTWQRVIIKFPNRSDREDRIVQDCERDLSRQIKALQGPAATQSGIQDSPDRLPQTL